MDKTPASQASLSDTLLEATLNIWSQARRQHLIPITGRSMLPLIQEGDRVLVKHGCADVRRGDVIVFRHEGRLIAHRVLRLDRSPSEAIFITKGDHAVRCDPPVRAAKILGRVLTVQRDSRQMSLDTSLWRQAGRLIAVGMLAWTKLYAWSWPLWQSFGESRPHGLTAFLRWGGQLPPWLSLKVIQAVAGRWRE